MRESWAIFRSGWQAAVSYRMNLVFSLAGLVVMLVPLYFVAHALQPVAAASIRQEGGEYFGFLLLGLAMLTITNAALVALPNAITSGISSGTLEAMLATPARLPAVLLGLVGYDLSWSLVRGGVTVLFGLAFGSALRLPGVPLALLALGLTLLAYLGMGLGLAAMILLFRTTGPLGSGLVAASALLGGVYYSTTVIPSWVQQLSFVVPLTYGLRLMRQALLGSGPPAGGQDLVRLVLLTGLLLAVGGACFAAALRHARREGTLGQY